MENRPAALRSRRVCRFCLTESEPLSFIYEKDNNRQFRVPLTLQIISCVGIEVYAADGMPQMICNMCRWNLDRAYKFKLQCKKADEALRAYPLSGVLPRPFPPIPNDPPEIGGKRPIGGVDQRSQNESKRSRIETREREREREKDKERERDRDRDRDRGQSDKQRDKSDYYEQEEEEEEQDSYRKDFRNSTKLSRKSSNSQSEDRPFPCKLCPRTFLLAHHLARHMRTHSVEKRHVCEDCGKAFKRKESLEVHQLTHTKRTGIGLTCDVCQESCRNRADYVTHIKQHIEAGEKMGPDGLQPDSKAKYDVQPDEEEEEDEEEQYSDGDDDYHPPAYLAKKMSIKMESEEELKREQDVDMEKEERKEQVVYVRNKDGSMVKKTIKTLMPIQRRDVQDTKTKQSSSSSSSSSNTVASTSSLTVKSSERTPSRTTEESKVGRVDETEAQVQKIVASVFKEHKIPLKHQNSSNQEQEAKESSNFTGSSSGQLVRSQTTSQQIPQTIKEEKPEIAVTASGTPKVINTVKVIKRIVVRKPGNSNNSSSSDISTTATSTSKECETSTTSATSVTNPNAITTTSATGQKVTKRVIVRRIIRQGDTTREVIMNPDGTLIDPAELAKLPTGNVVKRLFVRKAVDKAQGSTQGSSSSSSSSSSQQQSSTDSSSQPSVSKAKDSVPVETSKFELKTSQSSTSPSSASNSVTATSSQKSTSSSSKDEQNTKEKLQLLEKRVEEQRLQIEELQARKQQEYESIDEMLPERHDESEDEQQLPLKRVFVKRKQSIYDEEQEYNDDEDEDDHDGDDKATMEVSPSAPVKNKEKSETTEESSTIDESTTKVQELSIPVVVTTTSNSVVAVTSTPGREGKQSMLTSSKVYTNKKIIVLKTETIPDTENVKLEILDSSNSAVKLEDNMLSNLDEISAEDTSGNATTEEQSTNEPMAVTTDATEKSNDANKTIEELEAGISMDEVDIDEVELKQKEARETSTMESVEMVESQKEEECATITLDSQELSESHDIFEPSDNVLDAQKNNRSNDSVIELKQNETISLNDTNDTQDSLEDKLSQMEG